MAQTPSKRPASSSPEGARPTKRAVTSSPEEGELDEVTPDSIPRPLSPSRLSSKPKVPFPFKKRADLAENGLIYEPKESFPLVYERSEEDERRIREADMKRKPVRPGQDEYRRRVQPSTHGDHWEPGMDAGRDGGPHSRRDNNHHRGDRNHSAYGPRDRDRPARERRPEWDHSAPSSSLGDHHRSRDRASPSPPSLNRSRSQSSHSSHHREVHRLPITARSPELAFTPPRRDYGVDRIRDREWQRDRDRRYNDDESTSPYSRNREWPRDPHGHYSLEHGDRYWRPERDVNGFHVPRRDDQPWTHDEAFDADRDHGHERSRNYRPSSPSFPPSLTSSPKLPASGPRTPPPPSGSPPPPPPLEPLKDDTLPKQHAVVSIPIPAKRPGAPKCVHSPPSLSLPAAKPANGGDKDKGGGVKKETEMKKTRPLSAWEAKALMMGRKRAPAERRSAKEETKAYGRAFVGCGHQNEYEITTKLGEGTFGEVHKAIHTSTGKIVALKRVLMHNQEEGMPVTALREIKILKALNHPCIVQLLDIFVVRSTSKDPLSVYMVFPYMDHDLAGLLDNERVKLQPSHIKLYMKQLLEGTEYMHRNHILHRDMKAANLLISNNGSLCIADFGLARTFDHNAIRGGDHHRRYTNCVVTRWYRPPELLLGAQHYGGEVDIWGIGCVLGEMFNRKPILAGTSDLDQLDRIWRLCGTPNQHSWPNFDALPGCEGVKRFNDNYTRRIKTVYESIGTETCDLLDKLLTCNPRARITASQALDHDYFWTDPLPADPKTLPSYEASHEFDKRGRRPPQAPAGPPVQPRGDAHFRPPPPTIVNPPLHFGRGGPPRDAFRTGPPLHTGPSGPPRPGAYHNNPHPYHPPHLYQHGSHPQAHPRMPPGGRGPPHPGPPHRPGPPPPPGQYLQDKHDFEKHRPPHLPPRPPAPLGRGMVQRGGSFGGGGSNSSANSGGELNYG